MSISIYLVEDNPVIRTALLEVLRALCNVEIAGWSDSEAKAREDLSNGTYDVVLIDLALSQGSGIGVLRSVDHRAGQRQMVVLTNFFTPPVRELCLSLGADRVFDKSTELAELVGYLRQLPEAK